MKFKSILIFSLIIHRNIDCVGIDPNLVPEITDKIACKDWLSSGDKLATTYQYADAYLFRCEQHERIFKIDYSTNQLIEFRNRPGLLQQDGDRFTLLGKLDSGTKKPLAFISDDEEKSYLSGVLNTFYWMKTLFLQHDIQKNAQRYADVDAPDLNKWIVDEALSSREVKEALDHILQNSIRKADVQAHHNEVNHAISGLQNDLLLANSQTLNELKSDFSEKVDELKHEYDLEQIEGLVGNIITNTQLLLAHHANALNKGDITELQTNIVGKIADHDAKMDIAVAGINGEIDAKTASVTSNVTSDLKKKIEDELAALQQALGVSISTSESNLYNQISAIINSLSGNVMGAMSDLHAKILETATKTQVDGAHSKLDALGGKLDASSTKLDSMDGKLDSTDGKLNAAHTKLDVVDGKLNATNGALASVGGKLDSVDGKLDSTDGKLNAAHSKLDSTNGKLGAMDGKLDATNGKLNAMDSKLSTIDTKLDPISDIEAKLNDLDIISQKLDDLTLIKNQLLQLSTINTKLNELANINSKLAAIPEINTKLLKLDTVDTKVGEIQTTLGNMSGALGSMGANLNTVDVAVGEINGKLDGIEAINSELTNILQTISSLDLAAKFVDVKSHVEGQLASLKSDLQQHDDDHYVNTVSAITNAKNDLIAKINSLEIAINGIVDGLLDTKLSELADIIELKIDGLDLDNKLNTLANIIKLDISELDLANRLNSLANDIKSKIDGLDLVNRLSDLEANIKSSIDGLDIDTKLGALRSNIQSDIISLDLQNKLTALANDIKSSITELDLDTKLNSLSQGIQGAIGSLGLSQKFNNLVELIEGLEAGHIGIVGLLQNIQTAQTNSAGVISDLKTNHTSMLSSLESLKSGQISLGANIEQDITALSEYISLKFKDYLGKNSQISGQLSALHSRLTTIHNVNLKEISTKITGVESAIALLADKDYIQSALDAKFSTLATDLNGTLAQISGVIVAINDTLGGFNSTLTECIGKFTELFNKLNAIQSTVNDTNTTVSSMKTVVDGLDTKADVLDTKVVALKTVADGAKTTVDAMHSVVDGINAQVSDIDESMNTVKSEIGTGEIQSIKQAVQNLSVALGIVTGEIRDYISQHHGDISAKSDALSAKLDALNAKLDNLPSCGSSNEFNLDELKGKLSSGLDHEILSSYLDGKTLSADQINELVDYVTNLSDKLEYQNEVELSLLAIGKKITDFSAFSSGKIFDLDYEQSNFADQIVALAIGSVLGNNGKYGDLINILKNTNIKFGIEGGSADAHSIINDESKISYAAAKIIGTDNISDFSGFFKDILYPLDILHMMYSLNHNTNRVKKWVREQVEHISSDMIFDAAKYNALSHTEKLEKSSQLMDIMISLSLQDDQMQDQNRIQEEFAFYVNRMSESMKLSMFANHQNNYQNDLNSATNTLIQFVENKYANPSTYSYQIMVDAYKHVFRYGFEDDKRNQYVVSQMLQNDVIYSYYNDDTFENSINLLDILFSQKKQNSAVEFEYSYITLFVDRLPSRFRYYTDVNKYKKVLKHLTSLCIDRLYDSEVIDEDVTTMGHILESVLYILMRDYDWKIHDNELIPLATAYRNAAKKTHPTLEVYTSSFIQRL